MELFEYLGGHYIPTGVMGSYKLCDFLYKEPFFGKMYAKQFTGNWTCPFPPVSSLLVITDKPLYGPPLYSPSLYDPPLYGLPI